MAHNIALELRNAEPHPVSNDPMVVLFNPLQGVNRVPPFDSHSCPNTDLVADENHPVKIEFPIKTAADPVTEHEAFQKRFLALGGKYLH